MIRNNKLSYISVDRPWHSFEIQDTFLSSLVTSVFVTLISYQVAAILFSITLGLKKRNETKLNTFGIALLTRYLSSPLAVINSVSRLDWLTRLYYWGDIPSDTRISRDSARVKFRTSAVLLLLLVATPFIDTFLVGLVLARTNELTFEQAGFSGIGLGVEEELSVVETIPYLSLCRMARFEERTGDSVRAVFQLCDTPNLAEGEASNISGLDISLERQTHVYVRVIFRGSAVFGAKWTQLSGVGVEKNLKASISKNSVVPLVDLALDRFALHCGERTIIERLGTQQNRTFGGNNVVIASVRVACNNRTIKEQDGPIYATEIIGMLKQKLTFIKTERTLVRNITDPGDEFTEEPNGVLLQRTKRNSSMFTLIAVCGALILVRMTLGVLVANDVEDGLERLFLNRLGIAARSSTVWSAAERISFRRKYQDGDSCQLGMEREEMAEVERFHGGVVGKSFKDTIEENS
ncbi:unnamed protein product [Agarophyton chilense]|eukprot:gb/GEZJ01005255.1/.p1 GENE.gb/GEZJ01005255.1/~~gb/GEZJ01005255.1/.p1  ORF type:complete len:464 (-),score=51.95 gb/GEZJ01005255.1/:504-1895(-)